MSTRRLTGFVIDGREVREGDSVWGVQPAYYDHSYDGGNRYMAGVVFWNELAGEWRVCEDSFANHYVARDHPEALGYPLAKLQRPKLYPVENPEPC